MRRVNESRHDGQKGDGSAFRGGRAPGRGAPVRLSFGQEAFDDREVRQTAVIGPLRKLLNYELKPGSDLVVAVFTLDGFYRLFRVPLPELPGEALLDPESLPGGAGLAALWDTLREMHSRPHRVSQAGHPYRCQ